MDRDPIIENRPTYEEHVGKLEQLGFVQIDDSDLYKNGEVTVQVDKSGDLNFLTEFDEDLVGHEGEDLVGIAVGNDARFSGFYLKYLKNPKDRDPYTIDRTLNGSGGGGAEALNLSDFEGKPINDQLLDAGFVEDPSNSKRNLFLKKDIFSLVGDDDGEPFKLIAITRKNKLLSLLKEAEIRSEEHLTPNTEIVGFSRKEPYFEWNPPVPVLRLSNGVMEFDLSFEYGTGSISNQSVTGEIPSDTLGIKPFDVETDASGFEIGGTNDASILATVGSIQGRALSQLESVMRPGRSSQAGFLGENESLREVLMADNEFVMSHGLTHQQIAEPLLHATSFLEKKFGTEFFFKGVKYKITYEAWRGMQFSPFDDGTGTNKDLTVTNTETGDSVTFSGLVPNMIQRYGFYEGKGTPYRVEPSQILKVFSYLLEDAGE